MAFVAPRRLGLTADRTRVVEYDSVEAAFMFRAPGKAVTAVEAERYGISEANPLSPREWPAQKVDRVAEEAPPPGPPEATEEASSKESPPPQDKMVHKGDGARVQDKARGKRKVK